MIFVSGRIELDPAHVDAYTAEIKKLIKPTLQEPGCTLYAIARDVVEDNVLWISEEWDTEETLMTHLATPHVRQFLETVKDLTIISMDARQYEISSVGPLTVPEA